jgi:RND family efflux transporter MFP subunit
VGSVLATLEDPQIVQAISNKENELKEWEQTWEQRWKQSARWLDHEKSKPRAEEGVIILDDEDAQVLEAPPSTEKPANSGGTEVSFEPTPAEIREFEEKRTALRREIDALVKEREKLTIATRIPGMITQRLVTEGQWIEKPGQSLVEVSNFDPLLVDARLPDEVASYIDKKVNVRVSPADAPEIILPALIRYISPSIDNSTTPGASRTFVVQLAVTNPEGTLKSGQNVKVLVETRKQEKVWLVPASAVVRDEQGSYVYTVQGARAKRWSTRVLDTQDPSVSQVTHSLRTDDLVLIDGHHSLEDGSFIKVREQREW